MLVKEFENHGRYYSTTVHFMENINMPTIFIIKAHIISCLWMNCDLNSLVLHLSFYDQDANGKFQKLIYNCVKWLEV